MKIELAYSLDRQLRYVKNGSWYSVECRGNLLRWKSLWKSQRPMDFSEEIKNYQACRAFLITEETFHE